MKIKKLCYLKKNDISDHMKKIVKIIKKPEFVCDKCLRVAKDEKYLCNARKIK